MKLPKRLLAALMGVGVMGMVGSAGTLAVFTATSDNPGNSFTSGSIMLTDTTGFTSAATTLGGNAPNQSGTDPRGSNSDCTAAVVALTCRTLLKSVNVAVAGMEPGQYLRGTVTLVNSGTLPATVALQVQNVKTNNGSNSLYSSGASGYNGCASDIGGATSPGSGGAQLTSGATTSSGSQPLTGCRDLGEALRITLQDVGGAGSQCLFGNDAGAQAPTTSSPYGFGGGTMTTYIATSTRVGTGSGTCDDLSSPSFIGSGTASVTPGSNSKDAFGVQTAGAGNSSLAALSASPSIIFVPGGGTSTSLVNTAALGGNLTGLPQWTVNESHTFTVTVALPNTGTTTITDHNHDTYFVGNDNPYEGGAVSFDLYWFAVQ